ncbi:MAG: hypothetical protein P4L40_01545 [Terracidiphilus sp.]|nr:hypothetical protein [Terracidiphilus sp.]
MSDYENAFWASSRALGDSQVRACVYLHLPVYVCVKFLYVCLSATLCVVAYSSVCLCCL